MGMNEKPTGECIRRRKSPDISSSVGPFGPGELLSEVLN